MSGMMTRRMIEWCIFSPEVSLPAPYDESIYVLESLELYHLESNSNTEMDTSKVQSASNKLSINRDTWM